MRHFSMALHPASKARCKIQISALPKARGPQSWFHPRLRRSTPRLLPATTTQRGPTTAPPHTDNLRGPGLPIPPPRPTPRSFRPCTACSQSGTRPRRGSHTGLALAYLSPRLTPSPSEVWTTTNDTPASNGGVTSSPDSKALAPLPKPGRTHNAPSFRSAVSADHPHYLHEVLGQLPRLPRGRGPRRCRPHPGGAHRLPFRRTNRSGGGQILQPDLPPHHAQITFLASKGGPTGPASPSPTQPTQWSWLSIPTASRQTAVKLCLYPSRSLPPGRLRSAIHPAAKAFAFS